MSMDKALQDRIMTSSLAVTYPPLAHACIDANVTAEMFDVIQGCMMGNASASNAVTETQTESDTQGQEQEEAIASLMAVLGKS